MTFSERLRALTAVSGAAVAGFVAPVLPYGAICTAMVLADVVSARMLARRLRRKIKGVSPGDKVKFSSRRFGIGLMSLAKVYALLLLAHGVDAVIVGETAAFSTLRFSAALVCFWQFWSILENEASANDAQWARLAQRILIDKTSRHLGIDFSDLHPTEISHPEGKTK